MLRGPKIYKSDYFMQMWMSVIFRVVTTAILMQLVVTSLAVMTAPVYQDSMVMDLHVKVK